MNYGLFSIRNGRKVLVVVKESLSAVEALKRTFEYRRQFGQLEIGRVS